MENIIIFIIILIKNLNDIGLERKNVIFFGPLDLQTHTKTRLFWSISDDPHHFHVSFFGKKFTLNLPLLKCFFS